MGERWSQWPPPLLVLATLLEGQPVIGALLILMVLDVLVGIVVAIGTRTLSSSVSWSGMSKKAIMLLIVGAAAVIEPYAQGLPLAKLVALFYLVTEGLSILENAALAGVPLPGVLTETLAKLKEPKPRLSPAADGTVTVRTETTVGPRPPDPPEPRP